VASDSDLLLGKLAVTHGFCAQESIDWCLAIQSTSPDRLPLGQILIREGYLTQDQHSELLSLQRKNMKVIVPVTKKRRESILFGKLAVRERLLTSQQVNACLSRQAAEGERRSLGEIMVDGGFLTSQQVRDLLAKQQKRIMSCSVCSLSFTVFTISHGKKSVACPRCKGALSERRQSESTATDADLSTKVFSATKHEAARGSPEDSRVIPAGASQVKSTCVVCDQPFEGLLDSTGRLRCPGCRSTFVPK